jgi:hypothetical protein
LMSLSISRFMFVFLLSSFSVTELSACTCSRRSACASIARASEIFLGTAASEESQSDGSFIVHFDVKESFQGKAENKDDVISVAPGECGTTRFQVGAECLVFAGRTSEGRMAVGPCNPPLPAELAAADLRIYEGRRMETSPKLGFTAWWLGCRVRNKNQNTGSSRLPEQRSK